MSLTTQPAMVGTPLSERRVRVTSLLSETNVCKHPTPFKMAVFGDSVLWGIGLRDENKIHSKLVKWLETEVFRERSVMPLVVAHSGARVLPTYNKSGELLPASTSPEIGSSNPSVLCQIDLAVKAFSRQGISPDKVELIIVNGGANDLPIYNLLIMAVPRERIIRQARKFCYEAMLVVLKKMADTFPNARILIPGYYQLISRDTQPVELPRSLFGLIGLAKLGTIIHFPFEHIPIVRDLLSNRSATWKQYSDFELESVVNDLNRIRPMKGTRNVGDMPRAFFVPSPFESHNSYAAPDTYLWQLVDWGRSNDETRLERELLSRQEGKRGLWHSLCKKGAFGHPNVEGAHAYYEAIVSRLEPLARALGWPEPPFEENESVSTQ